MKHFLSLRKLSHFSFLILLSANLTAKAENLVDLEKGTASLRIEAKASAKALEKNSEAMITNSCLSAAQLQIPSVLVAELEARALQNFQENLKQENSALEGSKVKLKKVCKEDFLKQVRFYRNNSVYFNGEEMGTCLVQFDLALQFKNAAFSKASLSELEKCAIAFNTR